MIYGGLGSDFLHGGAGNDLISGAEAMAYAEFEWMAAQAELAALAGRLLPEEQMQ